jgi:hypothetical protein
MSQTLGPPIYIDGPLPVAPTRGLLSAATIVPTGSDRFGVGAAVWPYPPDLPQSWAPCSDGTYRTKDDGEGWELPIFNAFELYLPITCSSITAKSPGFADRARAAFLARESYGLAHELATGHSDSLNPHLTDSNLTILNGGSSVAPDVALSYLEDAIGATGQVGLIHLTPATGAAMNGSGGYQLDMYQGRMLTTANGTPVALDGGYIDTHPESVPHAPATGTAWAYASGPVQIRMWNDVDILADDIKESMDRQQNDVTFRAERAYLTTWDTQLQVAVLVDWTP